MYRYFLCVEFEDIPQDEGEQQSNEDMLKNFKYYLIQLGHVLFQVFKLF